MCYGVAGVVGTGKFSHVSERYVELSLGLAGPVSSGLATSG